MFEKKIKSSIGKNISAGTLLTLMISKVILTNQSAVHDLTYPGSNETIHLRLHLRAGARWRVVEPQFASRLLLVITLYSPCDLTSQVLGKRDVSLIINCLNQMPQRKTACKTSATLVWLECRAEGRVMRSKCSWMNYFGQNVPHHIQPKLSQRILYTITLPSVQWFLEFRMSHY